MASSSLAALLIGGGAPAAWSCSISPGTNQSSVSNSGSIDCINIGGINVTNNVTNTGTGVITTFGTGININTNASVGGAIVNAGQISASGDGIAVSATVSGGISNAGTISAFYTGIYAQNTSRFGGGISNASSGTIIATTGYGIYVNAVSTFSGGISNSGQIAATSFTGINIANVTTFAGSITNSSSGTITGTIGIQIGTVATFGSSSAGGGITNAGTISGLYDGIHINNVTTFLGGISNAGTISAVSDGINIQNLSTFWGGIKNSGKIASTTSTGISISSVATFAGGIVNSSGGTLTGRAGIKVTGVTAFISSTDGGGITNSGTISATNVAVNVTNVATFSGAIVNSASGSITGIKGIGVSNVTSFGTSGAGGITNAGTISAGQTGILVNNVSTFSGDISNSGTISSAGIHTGINVSGLSTFAGNISNASSGVIAGANEALVIRSITMFAGSISNAGTISGGSGILFAGISTFTGGITNAGTISAAGYGVLVTSVSTFAASMTNSGTIIASGGSGMYAAYIRTFVDGISNGGTISANAGLYVQHISAFSGGIGNSGTIVANTYGIYANNNSTFSSGISNSGTIASNYYGIIVGQDARSHGAVSNSMFSGGITNSGAISAAVTGIYVNNVSSFSGNVSNAGTITGATAAIAIGAGVTFVGGAAIVNSGTLIGTGGTAIDASAATSAVTIDQNAGTITGAIKLSANADVLNIAGGSIAGNIVGHGTLDTINFNLGSGNTFTYGSAFSSINQVNIDSGKVVLNGANSATNVDVSTGGALAGTGSIDPTTVTIHSGGTFAPGNGTPGTSMTITGNLAFQSGATYQVYVNPGTSSFSTVSGTASLAGTVNANFAAGTYISKVYTILTAGSVTGTFGGLTTANLPSNFTTSLSYDTAHAYLDLTLNYTDPAPSYGSLNTNQGNVANALINYFNSNGRIPTAFGTLSSSALSHVDGESATGAQTSAFQLMNSFLDQMLDPAAGGGNSSGGAGATSFAPEQEVSLPPDVAHAYATVLQQQPDAAAQEPPGQIPQSFAPSNFDQRWSAWGSAFGGKSFTDGNAVTGSNTVAAIDYGFAGGMDYHATPDITYGFGLAGGGTSWNLAQGLDGGRSDAFASGVYAKTHWGPLYVSGAIAFANQWFTTNRTALGDQLRASFIGQNYAGRIETGYRYAVPFVDAQNAGAIIGVTPYAALQAQAFHTPDYSETDLTGGGFALSYNAMNATDTRSELGVRFDNLQIVDGMPLILRGRLAWAHDWVTDPALGAAFQTLAGANFTVNGAAPPKNSALTTAAAELHITSNWTAIAKFDGDFGPGAQTYGGTATLRYSW